MQKAVELLPTQSRSRTLLGLAYEKSGDFEAATKAYNDALALDPKDTETSLHLAQLYLRQNRAADAETKFRQVLANEPESQPALLGLAQASSCKKNLKRSRPTANTLPKIPTDAVSHEHLVQLLIANGKN